MRDSVLVGDFVMPRRGTDPVLVVAEIDVLAETWIATDWWRVIAINEHGESHYFAWLDEPTWPRPLLPAEPGDKRKKLNKQLRKWRRKHGKAL